MNTRLTVADARANLYTIINAGDPNDPRFLMLLNEVCERYINSGKWKGTVLEVDFANADGFISLPYEFLGVLCLTYDKAPALAYSQFHAYQINGPGEYDEAKKWRGILEDMGDGWATQANISTAGTLRIKTNAADNGKTIRIYGLDENNNPIFDNTGAAGIAVTTAAPFVDTTQQFSQVTGIEACPDPVVFMTRHWTLHVNDGNDTQIGYYYPGENRPMYRRYKTGNADKHIRLLCQRRFLLMRFETDWVFPGNLTALKSGLWSLQYEDSSDLDKSQQAFEQGLYWLNNEAKAARGGIIPGTAFVNWGLMGGCGGGGGNGYGTMVTM